MALADNMTSIYHNARRVVVTVSLQWCVSLISFLALFLLSDTYIHTQHKLRVWSDRSKAFILVGDLMPLVVCVLFLIHIHTHKYTPTIHHPLSHTYTNENTNCVI